MIKEPPQVREYTWRDHAVSSRIQSTESSFRDYAVSITVDQQAYAFLMALTALTGNYRLMNLRKVDPDGTSTPLRPNRTVGDASSTYALGVNLCIDDFEEGHAAV